MTLTTLATANASYFVFGFLHELSHFFAGMLLGIWKLEDLSSLSVWTDFLLRRCTLPHMTGVSVSSWKIVVTRHFGWISTLVLAILYHRHRSKGTSAHDVTWIVLAAYITTIDAFSSDLFLLPRFNETVDYGRKVLYCGNFGVIILNSAWYLEKGEKILDVLEKMIQVTMMRGAQTGGVVTFQGMGEQSTMKGYRVRCVKTKRGDLSVQLRKSMQPSMGPALKTVQKLIRTHPNAQSKKPQFDTPGTFFAGHTRFATSSIADLRGCHPHQWSKPRNFKIYDMADSKVPSTTSTQNVENFICHNGDFEYYKLNGESVHGDTVIDWLQYALGYPIPCTVDSIGIAGMVDLIRCSGCFALSIRYVLCLDLSTSRITGDSQKARYPSMKEYEALGESFELALKNLQINSENLTLEAIRSDPKNRERLVQKVLDVFTDRKISLDQFSKFISDTNFSESHPSVLHFVEKVCDAFFDNDLMQTVKIFMSNAKGSFGLCVMSSLDAQKQLCLACRGQTISVAFYPKTGLVCYGSEQAAVKAGVGVEPSFHHDLGQTTDKDCTRLDLNDLAGEICLLDWSIDGLSAVSPPNRGIKAHDMLGNRMKVYLHCESQGYKVVEFLHQRLIPLTDNEFVSPLPPKSPDLIRQDLKDIPRICKQIQDNWNHMGDTFTLNRLTAWNLGSCIKKRLNELVDGNVKFTNKRIDILVTGCEVSLWLGEQFASDLQKAFPGLNIVAISSNKLLGIFGQETITIPAMGFESSIKTMDLENAITIIISHSGGTFSPLACSSLFQSITRNIFVVASEWDTQIGKQLRSINANSNSRIAGFIDSRIFTTGVGIRPAEPCSVSVAATHQLLTNIFQHISILILSDPKYRDVTRSVITENDLKILARCNKDNIYALADIVGVDISNSSAHDSSPQSFKESKLRSAPGDIWSDHSIGVDISNSSARDRRPPSFKESELRLAGDIWSDHILEVPKAYIMSIVYILVTVISGFPLASGIAAAAGLISSHGVLYLLRALDALIYIWLPQINVLILRILQQRPLRHRITGRTVVIGDIPWVAQSAEAFLSKIFACSYSIAGLNVHSGNPSDHLVHRHTHRVVRGSLLIVGRPDGRLSALTAMENSVSLSVNQASSIQSIGGRCESVTIGHNPFKLPLTARAIVLERHRPLFMCEKMQQGLSNEDAKLFSGIKAKDTQKSFRSVPAESSHALLGKYKDFYHTRTGDISLHTVLADILEEVKKSSELHRLFDLLDVEKDGKLYPEEFIKGMMAKTRRSEEELLALFHYFDADDSGYLTFDEFSVAMSLNEIDISSAVNVLHRDERGLIQVLPSKEDYFGQHIALQVENVGESHEVAEADTAKNQGFAHELYESRIASLQRFTAMTVMFHQMGWRVERFFSKNTFGLLGYRMDRTHSIMRIATTASPISGADIWNSAQTLFFRKKVLAAVSLITRQFREYLHKKRDAKFHKTTNIIFEDIGLKDTDYSRSSEDLRRSMIRQWTSNQKQMRRASN